MITKKICMIGDFAVGKSSTVERFVKHEFSDDYMTTVGVKIDTTVVDVDEQLVKFVLWDIAGTDSLKQMSKSYLKGMSAYVLVADGTRAQTLETALNLKKQVDDLMGEEVPFVGLLNKYDLQDKWEISDSHYDGLLARGWSFHATSALTGNNVHEAFVHLAKKVLKS